MKKSKMIKKIPGKRGPKPWEPTERDYKIISELASSGCTHSQICAALGISTVTLFKHKKQIPELRECIKRAQCVAVADIENALFKSAKRGNSQSIIFFLKSRNPKYWNDKTVIKHENADGKNIDTSPKFIAYVPQECANSAEWVASNNLAAASGATDTTTDVPSK